MPLLGGDAAKHRQVVREAEIKLNEVSRRPNDGFESNAKNSQ